MAQIIRQTKWFFHPIFVFIFSIVALTLSLILYIYWYVEVSTGFKEVLQKFNLDPDPFLKFETWVVILVLSILVGIILVGIFIIFAFNQKTIRFYRLQHNFINNFTHELKTPVTSLKLYLETFTKHDIPRNDQLKYLGYMAQDIERLSDNISRILDLAKIESRIYGGKFTVSDLVETVDQFLKNNTQLFPNCKINVHNPSGRSFWYRINPALFEMILINLLTNAVKYNDAKTPEVDITFEPYHRKLHLKFEDNGIGIQQSEIKKIFRKFYQSGRSDDMSAKGSGLGLYLVQNIARIHKGKVVAESKGSGKGSVFRLILPYKSDRK